MSYKNIIEEDLSSNEPEYLINDEPTDECTEKQQEIVLSQLPNYTENDIFEMKKDQNHMVYEFDFKRLNQTNNLENFPNFPEFHISREFIDEYRQRKLKDEFNHLRLKDIIKEIFHNEKKEYYQKQIENTFKNEILKKKEYNQSDYNNYVYHYTDARSMLSILVDRYIYPKRANMQFVNFTPIEPNQTDEYIAKNVLELKDDYRGPLLEKLKFAFGINRDHSSFTEIAFYDVKNKKVSLRDFILIVRNSNISS